MYTYSLHVLTVVLRGQMINYCYNCLSISSLHVSKGRGRNKDYTNEASAIEGFSFFNFQIL
jgi:hypothetical protein